MLGKGVEFLLSLPILAVFAIIAGAQLNWQLVLFPLAIVLQGALITGLGLIIAPLVVFFRDLERATKLILRVLFYASPIIYSISDLPAFAQPLAWLNPLSGIFSLYRAAFFPEQLNWGIVGVSAAIIAVILWIGVLVFKRSIGSVLKEL
jgi:ABC-2 type transport system permease protein